MAGGFTRKKGRVTMSERIDTRVKSLVDKAYNEEELTCEQLAFLLDLPHNTPSGEYVMAQADEMSRQAAKGRGLFMLKLGLTTFHALRIVSIVRMRRAIRRFFVHRKRSKIKKLRL